MNLTNLISDKKYEPRGFLRQVATGQFVDLATLGIFFNLL
jgi:hypothetical protein